MIITNKKLPKIYANKIETNGNNKNVFYSTKEETSKTIPTNKSITKKINDIFNSPNYIYKADVEIKLKDKTLSKRIIGKNKTHIITMDNELIPISQILDIKRK